MKSNIIANEKLMTIKEMYNRNIEKKYIQQQMIDFLIFTGTNPKLFDEEGV